jgi:uncharacterized protein YdcH (DUF465 family)
MREFLKGLDLDRETINTIMAEHGKLITEAKEKIREYEDQISELKGSGSDSKKIQEELDSLKKSVAEKAENEKLTNDIMAVIGNKKFASDYAKNGLIADVKAELGKEENKGKEMKDIVASLTKDKSGIFANPQQPNMAGMSNKVYDNVNKEAFNKMGYQERVSFKQENPELFAQLNSEE